MSSEEWTIDPRGGLAPGTMIGPYRVESPLGEGGMGTVYRALDTKLNRPVAIKVLSDQMADTQARRRFQREAQMASSLNHPHILTVYDVGEFEERQYIVTEYVDGGTLKDWAARKGTTRQLVELLTGVADGLAAAHAANILHRDIKPANILVAKNGYAKLADFGLAKLEEQPVDDRTRTIDGHTRPGVILGTIAYMSPEQASGRPLDARSDIFSFGVVLYEQLAGRRPFEASTDLELLKTIIHGTPAPLPGDLPAALRLVAEKAMEKDVDERYQSMRELVIDLKRVRRLEQEDTPKEQAPVKPRGRWWAIAAGLAAILAIAGGVYWRLWQQDYFWKNPLANAVIQRVTDFDADERDAAISPDGKFATFVSNREGPYDAWITQLGSDEFVNVSKGKFNLPIAPSAVRFVGFTGDGSQAWFEEQVSLRPNKIRSWLVSTVGGAPHPMLDDGFEPAWSPDGKQVVFHTAAAGDPIFLADRNGGGAHQIYVDKPGVHCHYLNWSVDGRYIYFVRGAPTTDEMDIWRFPLSADGKAGAIERITHHNSRVGYPVWLDARTLIYAADDGSGEALYALNVEHGVPHRVSSGVTEQYLSVAAAVSGDGRPRLVATVANPSTNLWTVPVSDRIQTEDSVTRLATPTARAEGPRLGPGYVLYLSSKGGGKGLWKLENGSAREIWKGSDGGVMAAPAISPDGTKICFAYRKQDREGLYVMNADGTNVRVLVDSFPVRGIASWSPDGKWIAAAGNPGDGTSIFKVPVDGGPPIRLLNSLSYHPVWSPDSKRIIYAEPQQGGGTLPVKAISPDKVPVPMPEIEVTYLGSPYRFVPHSNALIFLKATTDIRKRNFYWVDLDTGKQRQLTDLKAGYLMENFDISPDGKQIVFDRTRENSDVVSIDLH